MYVKGKIVDKMYARCILAAKVFLKERGYTVLGVTRTDDQLKSIVFLDNDTLVLAPVSFILGIDDGFPEDEVVNDNTHSFYTGRLSEWIDDHQKYASYALRIDTITLAIIASQNAMVKHHIGVYFPSACTKNTSASCG